MRYLIIDVREPYEFAGGHVIDSINIPLGEFINKAEKISKLSKTDEIILYYNSGNRSGLAMKILQNLGYKNITNGINSQNVNQSILN